MTDDERPGPDAAPDESPVERLLRETLHERAARSPIADGGQLLVEIERRTRGTRAGDGGGPGGRRWVQVASALVAAASLVLVVGLARGWVQGHVSGAEAVHGYAGASGRVADSPLSAGSLAPGAAVAAAVDGGASALAAPTTRSSFSGVSERSAVSAGSGSWVRGRTTSLSLAMPDTWFVYEAADAAPAMPGAPARPGPSVGTFRVDPDCGTAQPCTGLSAPAAPQDGAVATTTLEAFSTARQSAGATPPRMTASDNGALGGVGTCRRWDGGRSFTARRLVPAEGMVVLLRVDGCVFGADAERYAALLQAITMSARSGLPDFPGSGPVAAQSPVAGLCASPRVPVNRVQLVLAGATDTAARADERRTLEGARAAQLRDALCDGTTAWGDRLIDCPPAQGVVFRLIFNGPGTAERRGASVGVDIESGGCAAVNNYAPGALGPPLRAGDRFWAEFNGLLGSP